MINFTVSLIAFTGATKDVLDRGEKILRSKLRNFDFEVRDTNADAVFILTGGSENQVKDIVNSREQILILAMSESNSYAAATEIKAFCNQNKIDSILYNIDSEKELETKLEFYFKSIQALRNLKDYQIGLIGNVSEWLISSDIDKKILNNKLGIQIEKIAWTDFPLYSEYPVNSDFLDHFSSSELNLEDSSKVYNLILDMVKQRSVNAITVECFPLVIENAVTACLALSKLNTEGFASGCEGDITSIVGKILLKELSNQIPWMANLASIEDDKVFFAHCTIATDLISDYEITTHFETNKGTAVQGKFESEDATVFRINNDLSKAFLSYGQIDERPNRADSCRTQIKINIPTNDLQKLKDNPLGNHHLILPGDYQDLLNYFCKLTGIELI